MLLDTNKGEVNSNEHKKEILNDDLSFLDLENRFVKICNQSDSEISEISLKLFLEDLTTKYRLIRSFKFENENFWDKIKQ